MSNLLLLILFLIIYSCSWLCGGTCCHCVEMTWCGVTVDEPHETILTEVYMFHSLSCVTCSLVRWMETSLMAVTSESRKSFTLVYAEFPRNDIEFGITRFMETVLRPVWENKLYLSGTGSVPSLRLKMRLIDSFGFDTER